MINSMKYMKYNTLIRNDRKWKIEGTDNVKTGGGICTYIRKTLHFNDYEFRHLNKSTADIEIQCVVINPTVGKTQILPNVYRPREGKKPAFIDKLIQTVESITNRSKYELVIVGDMNIDILEQNEIHSKRLVDELTDRDLRCKIKEVTRFSETRNSCLDLAFVSSMAFNEAGV